MRNQQKLQFRISAGLKDIIGRDLISDDYIAIFELVKNAYDAHATKIEISFLNIESGNGKIIIKDNGKGMNFDDLVNKWLFVAYSAKKEGTEDSNYDYRDKINSNKPYAGAKGIGRFSCDKLGQYLHLETTKQEPNSKTEVLLTDWGEFEKDNKNEFKDINLLHETKNESDFGLENGTILIIENLRSTWDRKKYLKLKDSLAKLINPASSTDSPPLEIVLNIPEELNEDNRKGEAEYQEIVNGKIRNFIFETLSIKTTKIISEISEDGKSLNSKLIDGGTVIYEIEEANNFPLLSQVRYQIYYLNRSAKTTFTRKMGVQNVNYGNIFLYKNGFRVYPYGEPGEDPLNIDRRKAQGYNRFLGTRELIGQIEILSDNEELKETSSRGDGLKKTESYEQLIDCFWEALKKLEKYVVEVQQWGLSIEEDESLDFKERMSSLLANITGSQSISDFKVPENLLEIIESSQESSAQTIVNNLNKLAIRSQDDELIKVAKSATEKFEQSQVARLEAEKQADEERKKAVEATKKLREKISENLFLKSINSSDYEEVISLIHHIGIYAGTIDNNLKGISLRIQNNIALSNEELYDIIRKISFETKKILNISSFATKANFKLITEEMEVDLNNYVREYIQNIIPTVTDKSLNIKLEQNTSLVMKRKIKPIELNIVLDNIINNAKKARASELLIKLNETQNGKLEIQFQDNGVGIPTENLEKIYNFGFTTTDGSGIGLFHVAKILKSMKGSVKATNNSDKGATFSVKFT